MTSPDSSEEETIPVAEERLKIEKETVETGRVQLSNRIEEEERTVRDTLARERVRVDHVPVDHMSDDPPEMRTQGDRLVVPVFEEVLVKRYRTTEEIHLVREKDAVPFEDTITLRRNRVEVDRD